MTQDSMPSREPERSASSAAAVGGVQDDAAPPIERPQALVAWQLRTQGAACAAMRSPLYAELLGRAAEDVLAGGPCWTVLQVHVAPGRGDALALRFMAAVHRLVLTRRASRLALHYPSVGGRVGNPASAWAAFLEVVEDSAADLHALVGLPCQTNEVGRAAALVGGLLDVAAVTGLPLRVLEVGASAGLNLRWDRFRYGGGGRVWGPEGSSVDLTGLWSVPPPVPDVEVAVVARRGCDRAPVDPTSAAGRLALSASVWADHVDRFARLRGALALAAAEPIEVERAPLDLWVGEQLADRIDGVATVMVHSVVEEYLPGDVRARFRASVAAAGARATAAAPLTWLRLEPISALRSHGLTQTDWPAGGTRTVARCGGHGSDVVWLAPEGG
jgi:hypothetical protein